MRLIKGRYVAQIEVDFEIDENESELSLDKIRDNVTNNFTPVLQDYRMIWLTH